MRQLDRAARIAITLAAVASVSLPIAAQRGKPREVAGCPSTPAAFHNCALAKAKTFNPPRTPDGQPDMQGMWETPMAGGLGNIEGRRRAGAANEAGPSNSLVVDPPDGMIPYQAWAREQRTENNAKYIDPYTHCIPMTSPRIMSSPRGRQFLQYPGYMTVINESGGHPFRVIYTDGRPHLPADIKLYRGDSRGHWEGNTLVVEMTNLIGLTWFGTGGDFFSDAMKITERLFLVDADTIDYAVTLDDPKVLTRPWTMAYAIERMKEKSYEWMEEDCFESDKDTAELLLTGFKMYTGPRFPK